VKKVQDMELENESVKSEITYNKAELSRKNDLLRYQEETLKCTPALNAQLDKTKKECGTNDQRGKKSKAESQIMLKKMHDM
jgi:hypothetical protein